MKKYIKYLNYLLRHKWYVLIECFKRGLIWRGILHDLSKFRPDEFIPYARYFYGNYPEWKKTPSGIKEQYFGLTKEKVELNFDYAWLLHQKRNPHHWQYWILKEDSGNVKVFEIPYLYKLEMLCDWIGAGKALGIKSPINDKYYELRNWWNANNHNMQLHSETRRYFNQLLKPCALTNTSKPQ